jgi:hypothetical protein
MPTKLQFPAVKNNSSAVKNKISAVKKYFPAVKIFISQASDFADLYHLFTGQRFLRVEKGSGGIIIILALMILYYFYFVKFIA